jgi:hypothetical protein
MSRPEWLVPIDSTSQTTGMGKRPFGWLARHRRAGAVTGFILVAVAVGLIAFWPISLEGRARRIQPGMTEIEVEKVMGLPHGYYGTRARRSYPEVYHPNHWSREWVWDQATVTVWFDATDRAKLAEYRPAANPPTLFEQLREGHLP